MNICLYLCSLSCLNKFVFLCDSQVLCKTCQIFLILKFSVGCGMLLLQSVAESQNLADLWLSSTNVHFNIATKKAWPSTAYYKSRKLIHSGKDCVIYGFTKDF